MDGVTVGLLGRNPFWGARVVIEEAYTLFSTILKVLGVQLAALPEEWTPRDLEDLTATALAEVSKAPTVSDDLWKVLRSAATSLAIMSDVYTLMTERKDPHRLDRVVHTFEVMETAILVAASLIENGE